MCKCLYIFVKPSFFFSYCVCWGNMHVSLMITSADISLFNEYIFHIYISVWIFFFITRTNLDLTTYAMFHENTHIYGRQKRNFFSLPFPSTHIHTHTHTIIFFFGNLFFFFCQSYYFFPFYILKLFLPIFFLWKHECLAVEYQKA